MSSPTCPVKKLYRGETNLKLPQGTCQVPSGLLLPPPPPPPAVLATLPCAPRTLGQSPTCIPGPLLWAAPACHFPTWIFHTYAENDVRLLSVTVGGPQQRARCQGQAQGWPGYLHCGGCCSHTGAVGSHHEVVYVSYKLTRALVPTGQLPAQHVVCGSSGPPALPDRGRRWPSRQPP